MHKRGWTLRPGTGLTLSVGSGAPFDFSTQCLTFERHSTAAHNTRYCNSITTSARKQSESPRSHQIEILPLCFLINPRGLTVNAESLTDNCHC